jgi:branched-chain amino acid transport system substrate-binding protein
MVTRSLALFIFLAIFVCQSCGVIERHGREGETPPEPDSNQIGRENEKERASSREEEALPEAPGSLTIGLVLPLTGELASFGQAILEGSLVARKELASERGLAVELEIVDNNEDYASGTIETVIIARRLAAKGIPAVIGPLTTPCAVAAGLALAGDSILVISPTSSAYELPDVSFNVFSFNSPNPLLAARIAEFAVRELDVRKFAILYPEDAYGELMSASFIREAESLGAEVAVTIPFTPSQTTFESEVQMVSLYAPQALFLPAYSDDIVQIAPQIPYYGAGDVLLLGTDGFNYEEVLRDGGSYVEGAYFCDSFAAESPALRYDAFSRPFIDFFRKEPTKISAWGYDAVTMIADAWASARESRPGALLAEFIARREFTGASGIYRQAGGRLEREGFLFTISGGEIVGIESDNRDPAGHRTTGAQEDKR